MLHPSLPLMGIYMLLGSSPTRLRDEKSRRAVQPIGSNRLPRWSMIATADLTPSFAELPRGAPSHVEAATLDIAHGYCVADANYVNLMDI